MIKSDELDKNLLIIAIGGIALLLLTMLTVPLADDWTYLTSPKVTTEFELAHYRRLCDILIGRFNQAHPETFPWLNRFLIVSSHTVCAVFLYKISKEILAVRKRISLVFALLFLIGGNTIATVLNYDCFNQTGSLMFGAIGIYLFCTATGTVKKYIVYFISCALSLCVKEAGIVYFAIIPLFGFIKSLSDDSFNLKTGIKVLALYYVPGFICALLYYFSPIIQSQKMWVYGTGNYPITSYIIGIMRRLGFAYTQIDQTSVISIIRNRTLSIEAVLTFLCVILSIPILLFALSVFIKLAMAKSRRIIVFLLIVLASIIVFTPYLMSTPTGSIWSQNCIVFFANLTFCVLLNEKKGKILNICVAAFTISSIISLSSLMYNAVQTGIIQANAVDAIKKRLDPHNDVSSYIVYHLNDNRAAVAQSYPFRLNTMQQIFDSGSGSAFVNIFGYDSKSAAVHLSNDKLEYRWDKPIILPDYLDLSDSELLEYAQRGARKAVDSGEYDVALVILHTDEFYLYQSTK